MKHGICLSAIYPEVICDCGALLFRIDQCRRTALYDCLEFYFEGSKQEEIRIRRKLEECSLSLIFLAGFPMKRDRVDISARDEKRRQQSVELTKRYYDRALCLGAEKMLILSGPAWEEKDEERLIDQTVRSLKELDEYAAGKPCEMTLEYFPVTREPYLAVGKSALVKKIYEKGSFRQVGITFDASHVAQLGEDMIASFRLLKPWIHHLHLANSMSKDPSHPMYGDKHPLFSLENGDYSLQEIKEYFRLLTQRGDLKDVDAVSMEVISRGMEDWYFTETAKEAACIWQAAEERRRG